MDGKRYWAAEQSVVGVEQRLFALANNLPLTVRDEVYALANELHRITHELQEMGPVMPEWTAQRDAMREAGLELGPD
jgi:hypothetical protein